MQYNAAMDRIAKGDITALYGFSAGGYNVNHIIRDMSSTFRSKLTLAVMVGSPGLSMSVYPGISYIIFANPPEGHLHGPQVLLLQTAGEMTKSLDNKKEIGENV